MLTSSDDSLLLIQSGLYVSTESFIRTRVLGLDLQSLSQVPISLVRMIHGVVIACTPNLVAVATTTAQNGGSTGVLKWMRKDSPFFHEFIANVLPFVGVKGLCDIIFQFACTSRDWFPVQQIEKEIKSILISL
jgi:hypothetical protein